MLNIVFPSSKHEPEIGCSKCIIPILHLFVVCVFSMIMHGCSPSVWRERLFPKQWPCWLTAAGSAGLLLLAALPLCGGAGCSGSLVLAAVLVPGGAHCGFTSPTACSRREKRINNKAPPPGGIFPIQACHYAWEWGPFAPLKGGVLYLPRNSLSLTS